jgi:TDG/mug DNA glycosylase family protein
MPIRPQEQHRPTTAELHAAKGKPLRDAITQGLTILFVGINPSLYSAAVGHHFGRPGNRFWKVLHKAGFTETQLQPAQDRLLLKKGMGITNVVNYATAKEEELTDDQIAAGKRKLIAKVKRARPRAVAILGKGVYARAFGTKAAWGRQAETIGNSEVWLLPNPSGRSTLPVSRLIRMYKALRETAYGRP